MKQPVYLEVKIEKLVHGGQGLGSLADGRKAFVWNALPNEQVKFLVTKKKRDWCEGVATQILTASPERIEPLEPAIFTATSPWQIMNYQKEAEYKQAILAESFEREHVQVEWQEFYQDKNEFGYRNKMEYNFWFDNETQKVSLALHKRGTHQKVAVSGSALASDAINNAGEALIDYINANNIEARPLKSVIIRSDASGSVGMSLFVNDPSIAQNLTNFNVQGQSLDIIFSEPRSPASVASEVLVPSNLILCDTLLGREFKYSPRSFFQVNIPVYEAVLNEIADTVRQTKTKQVVDLYSGVGSIGLSIVANNQKLTMVELSETATQQAVINMAGRSNCSVVTATAEQSLEYIEAGNVIIVDPPRAGLHASVVQKLVTEQPAKIVYLSCNPSTQARDVKALVTTGYKIVHARGYNFFPRTPHIESLLVLSRV